MVQCTEMWESGGQTLKLGYHADNTKSDPKSDLCVCEFFCSQIETFNSPMDVIVGM